MMLVVQLRQDLSQDEPTFATIFVLEKESSNEPTPTKASRST